MDTEIKAGSHYRWKEAIQKKIHNTIVEKKVVAKRQLVSRVIETGFSEKMIDNFIKIKVDAGEYILENNDEHGILIKYNQSAIQKEIDDVFSGAVKENVEKQTDNNKDNS